MATTQLERLGHRHPPTPVITSFSVHVVDGNGIEVAGEPVTVRFAMPGGGADEVHTVTDARGTARIVEHHASEPAHVIVTAAGESTGALRPGHGAHIAVEA